MLGQTLPRNSAFGVQSRQSRPSTVSVQALFTKKKQAATKKEKKPEKKQGFLSQFTDAIDFSQVRSNDDMDLIDKAKSQLGGKRQKGKEREKMSKEQYQALRRKVGGTARDYWKDFVEADEVVARRSSSGLSVPSGLPFLLAIVLGVVVATVVVSQSATTPTVAQSDPVASQPASASGSAAVAIGA